MKNFYQNAVKLLCLTAFSFSLVLLTLDVPQKVVMNINFLFALRRSYAYNSIGAFDFGVVIQQKTTTEQKQSETA